MTARISAYGRWKLAGERFRHEYSQNMLDLAAWLPGNTAPGDMLSPASVPDRHRFAITMILIDNHFESHIQHGSPHTQRT